MKYIPCLLVALLLVSCSPKDPNDPKYVVAKVDGEKITRAQLTEETTDIAKRFQASVEQLTDQQRSMLDWQALNEMINEKLVTGAAGKLKDSDVTAKVEEQFTKMKSQFPSEDVLKENLEKAGMTEEMLKTEMRKQASMEALIDTQFSEELKLPENAAKEFYDSNPQYWEQPESVLARHVLVLTPQGADATAVAESKKKAEDARKRVAGGENFEVVAREVSEDPGSKDRGGVLPPFGKGRMVPEFEKAAFSTEVGKLSPVFKTSYGFHFLEVMDKQAARTLSFEEVQNKITRNLVMEKRMNASKKVIEKLREDAKVEINIPDPTKAAETAPAPEAS